MMIPLEEIYQQIGQSIVDDMPDDWAEVWVTVHISTGVTKVAGRYRTKQDDVEKSFRVSRKITGLFLDLHTQTLRAGQPDWEEAVFLLKPGGEFIIDYKYQDD
jgi:hypothetical protein